ncbi:acetyltransferase [Bradyrhizobium sp. YR681]|uniref:GNAT family N-acetyltransferase n=1 Tax=Bradyrhizobium sp. YR681 TaxID=1144344 RepID=UPI0002710D1D|nr:GNAT family N-acetyltransferase [Bradyrhizobium sp. YR681]EJN11809.1 acetyltransferase [Bradyrhizobium sp. YR681]
MSVQITHYSGIDGTPAVALALRGQYEMINDGGEQAVGLHHSYNGILASIDGKAVGVIIWFEQKDSHRLWLQLGYVLPEHRRNGIYNMLWDQLVDKARKLGASAIWSGTAIGNDAMRAVARKQGRKEIAVSLKFDVPELARQ